MSNFILLPPFSIFFNVHIYINKGQISLYTLKFQKGSSFAVWGFGGFFFVVFVLSTEETNSLLW